MRQILALAATAVLLAACGGGGSTAGQGATQGASIGLIHLLDHSPADDAVQVPAETAIRLVFDAPVALDTLGDEDTWLRVAGDETDVPGRYTTGSGGRTVVFTPSAPLALETDYEFQLSGLTSDDQGRLLDETIRFSFRTFDETPPTLTAISVAENEPAHSRTAPFLFTFSEAIDGRGLDASTLSLRDVFGFTYAGSREAIGNTLVFTPFADLPGSRQFTLELSGDVTDRAGNRLGTASSTVFTTAGDTLRPSVMTMWPPIDSTGVSPIVQPTYTFSESMDPGTVEPASLEFQDEFDSIVPFAIHASDDQRTLRVEPLAPLEPQRTYTLTFLLGPAGTTDVSGNLLEATQTLQFTTGSDATPPTVTDCTPLPDEERVSVNAILEIRFDEPLDPAWVDTKRVRLTAGEQDLDAIVQLPEPDLVRITPILPLPTDSLCTVSLRGGHEGLHDVAGNILPADHTFSFRTSADDSLPRALIMPPDGASGVPLGAHVAIVFDAPMDPATMTPATILFTDDGGTPIAGQLSISGGNRIARFVPSTPLSPMTYYRTLVRGGSNGVRRLSGSWFSVDRSARFRTGSGFDQTPPQIAATLNGIDASRTEGLLLPPYGFTVDVTISDPNDQSIDMSSIEVEFTGTGRAPDAETLFAVAKVDNANFQVRVPPLDELDEGDYTMVVRGTDLSGNLAATPPLSFRVAPATFDLLPFERIQVVWLRTDLDRDGNGRPDFDDDMLRLGLGAENDPIGANAFLRRMVLDGIMARANALYGRGTRGEPLDENSVWLRFTERAPIRIPHMQIAVGGFDPEGPPNRGYGDQSTGVLGRAFYDYRNANTNDRNTGTSPGLGVFAGEVWLYQTRNHIQSWPSFQTAFAHRFRPLAPDMGGTPAGTDPLDPAVLDPAFDYATAPSNQRARWLEILRAADDWARVIGTILAHEVGHSVGLVAPGDAPSGLFGDATLHDTYAGADEVMAAAVGYEAMLTLDYHFRDIDLAYLRQRVLLR